MEKNRDAGARKKRRIGMKAVIKYLGSVSGMK